ncbi:pyridoxamine 5'-phosphate oxidase family protein [Methanospirillum stamsii]|uniref:Pyridoxamine 5'-phosphate oxidase family protein n=1 Tax=Methanospirillum stamsii TaxID=1277351 RepID=A0A2V2N8W2_9EURY|nr:pyridoxamine 5'-phosphate oxidase family protein [Methanospirillum stamsii]PWR72948.1 hypothetical protein DLD82_11820 [Methanospirillum stamsii]
MRRRDKELSDPGEIKNILASSLFCHVGLSDGDFPYCVPMCFAYHKEKVYLHGAGQGKKIEILNNNPRVCIIVEQECSLIKSSTSCEYGMAYESVMIQGTARFLSGAEKSRGLEIISTKYVGAPGGPYPDNQISGIAVIEVTVESCSGRRSGMAASGLR